MRATLWGMCVAAAFFVAVSAASVSHVAQLTAGALLFRDLAGHGLDGIELDDQAFRLVGLPLVNAGGAMRDVTLVVFDAWDDEHGVLVQAIMERAFPGARVVQYDYAARIADCPSESLYMFLSCAQDRFADIFEEIVRDVDGYAVVNMSFKLYSYGGHAAKPVLEKSGCEKANAVVGDVSLRRIASAVMESPDRFFWVAAAGNERAKRALTFPACLSRVWAVSALSRDNEYDPGNLAVAPYSDWDYGDMVVAVPIGGRMEYMGYWLEGTSFAAPLFAGMVATWAGMCSTLPMRIEPRYYARVPGASSGAKAVVPTVLDVKC